MHSYFEGWYFRQQTDENTLALIPARHADSAGNKSASIQVVSSDAASTAAYPFDSFCVDRRSGRIRVGENSFSRQGVQLHIETDSLMAEGSLSFGRLTRPRSDIMGPFSLVPFLECRHSLFSLRHSVEGRVCVNGQETIFSPGVGYIEGDRGSSFPERYIWTQCSFGEDNSLMLSVADIPFLRGQFTGVIASVLLDGREYRIASYCGARVLSLGPGAVSVRQGDMRLSAELLEKREQHLQAPVCGNMTRLIRENVVCRARYRFVKGGDTLLDVVSNKAGFEFEWPLP